MTYSLDTDNDGTRRPKSSISQIATTVLIGLIGLFLLASAAVTIKAIDKIAQDTSMDTPSAVSQWLCLPYAQFVLDQHRAGLTAEQISAVLEVSEYNRDGQGGVTLPTADITEPRLDSMDACGFPFEIINAATPKP